MKNIKTYDSLLEESASFGKLNIDLLYAAEQLDVDGINNLIDMGADPNARDYYQQTPLHLAINNIYLRGSSKKKSRRPSEKEATHIVKLLLSRGADPNSQTVNGTTPVLSAAADLVNGAAVLKILIKAGANLNVPTNTGNTPMKRALGYYNKPFIIGLMRGGVNIMDEFKNIGELSEYFFGDLSWIPDDLMEKIKRIQQEEELFGEIYEVFPKTEKETPITAAVLFNKTEKLKKLIRDGYDVSQKANGWAPIHYAASSPERLESLKILLQNGADPNDRIGQLDTISQGTTPLWLAMSFNNKEAVKELFLAGADPFDSFGDVEDIMKEFEGDISWLPETPMKSKIERALRERDLFGDF